MKDFDDLGAFIERFSTLNLAVREQTERALGQAAKLVTAAARSELAMSSLLMRDELAATLEDEQRGSEAVSGTKSQIGLGQELAPGNLPPRSFMLAAVIRSQKDVEQLMADAVLAGLDGQRL